MNFKNLLDKRESKRYNWYIKTNIASENNNFVVKEVVKMKENKSTIANFIKYYIIYRIIKSIFGRKEETQIKSNFGTNFIMIIILLATYFIFLQ